jgi:hypothetical protein
LGGGISNILLAGLTINCNRFDWFWAGDGQPFRVRLGRWSEFNQEPPKAGEAPPGAIRNITIRNVLARAKGSSLFYGHAERRLEGVTLENVKLAMATDPTAPYDKAQHALDFRHARNVSLKNVEVTWEQPALEGWQSALNFEAVEGLRLEGFVGRAAWPTGGIPAIALDRVEEAVLCKCRAPQGTEIFLGVSGASSREIRLEDNELAKARLPCRVEKDVAVGTVRGVEVRPGK